MIASTIFAATAAFAQAALPWATVKDFDHFVELVDRDGAAFQTKAGTVVFLDGSAKETKRVVLPPNTRALFWTGIGGLTCAPGNMFTRIDDDGKPSRADGPWGYADLFAEGSYVFARMDDVVLLGPGNGQACGTSWAGPFAAISSDGDVVATMTFQRRPGFMLTYRRSYDGWVRQAAIVSPEIDDVGMCVPSPRADLRMIGKHVVVYLGQFSGTAASVAKQKDFSSHLLDLRAYPFNDEPPPFKNPSHEGRPTRKNECYLFATDLNGGWTLGLALFSYWVFGEPSRSETGLMTVSSDERFLYIVARDKILRLPIKEMLKKAGMKVD